ncbi:outer membrane beta-barrel protein [Porphyromonas pogonae]|uniref:outer membrane beta-barrel protein n=1 Tax=Porphyromonas pogonae TaxID=867595 RepID=UPI002E765CC4|nr:outer membrane beta-barrel protein [Porphyromonas pogonae]
MNNIYIKYVLAFTFLFASAQLSFSQNDSSPKSFAKSWDFGITVGLNVGATTPIPKPKSVEHVYTWHPHMNYAVKGWGTYRFNDAPYLGLTTGIELERKGMDATTRVKDIDIKMAKYGFPGEKFSGDNYTEVNNSYITVPFLFSIITANDRLRLHLGFYASYTMQNTFKVTLDGDGLIDGKPMQEGGLVDFDFSDQIASYDFGYRFGIDYYFTSRIAVTGQANIGMSSAIKNKFDVMPFDLHNAYGFLGISYRLFKY